MFAAATIVAVVARWLIIQFIEGDMIVQQDTSEQQAVLAELFEFAPADIDANRRGELSVAQKERIKSKHYANSRIAWIIFAIIFGLGLFGFSAEMIRIGRAEIASWLIYLGVMGFWALVVWGVIQYFRYQMNRTLQDGTVQQVNGKIHLFTERGERMMHRYFSVGKHRFRIDNYPHFNLLQQSGVAGREATLYIAKPAGSLLSVQLHQ